ncbi:MAG: glycosyltransferase family 2 protein [Aquihabitans sp.]
MTESRVRVVAVCPVHNRRDLTLQCLDSLLVGSDLSTVDLKVIIVDDGSTDGTTEAIRATFPEVEVVEGDGTLWYTAGTNRGIEAALAHEPSFILAMNDDQIFDTAAVGAMVDCAQRHPRSVIGALLVRWDDPTLVFQVDPQWETRFGGWHHWQHLRVADVPNHAWVVDLIVGNCLLYPVEAIQSAGLMDEKRFPMLGDAEYTPRMRRQGWQLLIEPTAIVECQPNDPAPHIRGMGPRELYAQLWSDRRAAYNLPRTADGLIRGGPTRWQGALAFVVLVGRMTSKAVGCAGQWPYAEPDRAAWRPRSPRSNP